MLRLTPAPTVCVGGTAQPAGLSVAVQVVGLTGLVPPLGSTAATLPTVWPPELGAGSTVIEKSAVPLVAAIGPGTVQVSVWPAWLQVAPDAETKVMPAGSLSTTVALVAGPLPELLTSRV